MFFKTFLTFLGSPLFGNLILLATVIVAFSIGWRQIALNDVVELYATPTIKQTVNVDDGSHSQSMVISIQNIGSRLVYLDRYDFNGSDYPANGQILPPTSVQSGGAYWIDLPSNGVHHVSIDLYYHDLDNRYWQSKIVADFTDNAWKAYSLPRTEQKPEN